MTLEELYQLLTLPAPVIDCLRTNAQETAHCLDSEAKQLYLNRATTTQGLEAFQRYLGEDSDGMRLLSVLLQMACETWEGYRTRGINKEIFTYTMKFVPRFLHTYYQQHGVYAFVWGWWFWRQLAMQEYRLGALEYELVEEKGRKEISLHIPSDADLRPASIDASFSAFEAFLSQQYPEWQAAPWVCDSWMMSPALRELLPQGSNIRAFQERFVVESVQEDSLGVLDWVFPPYRTVSAELPETTSLQRSMKAWLLSGKKIGWARAVLKR